MKFLAALLLIAGSIVSAAGGDYSLADRPVVVFPGGAVHVSPYPASRRAAAVWASGACWRECQADCTWKMAACAAAADADSCRPHLDACDRTCQRSCRLRGGPLLGFFDF